MRKQRGFWTHWRGDWRRSDQKCCWSWSYWCLLQSSWLSFCLSTQAIREIEKWTSVRTIVANALRFKSGNPQTYPVDASHPVKEFYTEQVSASIKAWNQVILATDFTKLTFQIWLKYVPRIDQNWYCNLYLWEWNIVFCYCHCLLMSSFSFLRFSFLGCALTPSQWILMSLYNNCLTNIRYIFWIHGTISCWLHYTKCMPIMIITLIIQPTRWDR